MSESVFNYGLSINRDFCGENARTAQSQHVTKLLDHDTKQKTTTRIDGDGMEKSNDSVAIAIENSTENLKRQSVSDNDSVNQRSKEIAEIEKKIITIESNLKEEKIILKNHLEVQVQVNQEIKKLLVASLGADLASHYERLATEKAQIALENEELKTKIDEKNDEIEKLNISCDIWRSKFLASRVQCDELHFKVSQHEQTLNDLDDATQEVLRDNQTVFTKVQETNANLSLLSDKLQLGKSGGKSCDGSLKDLSSSSLELSKKVACHLLGKQFVSSSNDPSNSKYASFLTSWNRISGKSANHDTEDEIMNLTPHEKHLLKLLKNRFNRNSVIEDESFASGTGEGKKSSGRFHLQVNYEKLTINCCNHCCGEIKVV